MYPFWKPVVEPVVRASGARRIVEIGALRGEGTALMLEDLGPDSELHVIDPVPEFDPRVHEERFGSRYVFHRDLSLNVLESIGAVDVALVDGDHNWYTVYHELQLLRDAARREDRPLPVLVLHDVCWPYGRRDLYYAPEQIPEEFRQPHRRGGMRPGRKSLLMKGGMNAQLHNAVEEGGPRNGVMTALDDFCAEHDRPLRRLLLPFYFGLAIVVEQDRLDASPELASLLDHLDSLDGKDEQLALSEQIRLEAAIWEQNVWNHKDRQIDAGAQRYLSLLKASLLGTLYPDEDVRDIYLQRCASRGEAPEEAVLADPIRTFFALHDRIEEARRTGRAVDPGEAPVFALAGMGAVQLDHLERSLATVCGDRIAGDLVECGVGKGGGAIFLRGYLAAHEIADRNVWVADPFRPGPGSHDLNQVRESFARFELLDDQVRFVLGDFAEALPPDHLEHIALLRVGTGDPGTIEVILDRLYDRVSEGGMVVVDIGGDDAAREAVERFRSRRAVQGDLEQVDWWAVSWRRSALDLEAGADVAPGTAPRRRAPAPGPLPGDPVDLTVVVTFYEMRREAARTLHSLSRAYQRGIEDLSYEVLVVDNGSSEAHRLEPEFVASFGPEFRLIDMGPDAPSSCTPSMNEGIRQGRGEYFALMVDGAHVLSPGVLRHGMTALRSFPPAVVATQQWYVGPGQQPDTTRRGYGPADEDALFDQIQWPADGYRLFDVSHFIGHRDWFDGVLESNCLLVPRKLLEQVGGFDDSFDMAGGGYTNLELYERLAASPDVHVVTLLGEGSFHQVHGGVTTNDTDVEARRQKTFEYGTHYEALRGRVFRGPTGPMHYVGAFVGERARRTRARRMGAPAFARRREVGGLDGIPETPVLMPDDLRNGFIDSFWQSLAWRDTTWLDRRVTSAPTDLIIYQELLTDIRPDWVIETGTGSGGRALFLATICELLGHGQVISVDPNQPADLPGHDRIRYLKASTEASSTHQQVAEIVGSGRTFVVLGACAARRRTTNELEGFGPLVSVGSYLIVENTIVNGHPVWPGFGPGPLEAVHRLLPRHGEFVADPLPERFGLTFNLGGFLKRVG